MSLISMLHTIQLSQLATYVMPGILLIWMACWWILCIMKLKVEEIDKEISQNKQAENSDEQMDSNKFQATSSYKYVNDKAFEGVVKIVIVSTAIGLLEIPAIINNLVIYQLSHFPHWSLYLSVALSGLVDVLVECSHRRCKNSKWILDPDILGYAAFTNCIIIEALIVHSEIEKDHITPMEKILLQMFFIAIVGSIISVFLEINFRDSYSVALLRPWAALTQGFWLLLMGCILCASPSFHWTEPMIPCMFCWTIGFASGVIALAFFIAQFIVQPRNIQQRRNRLVIKCEIPMENFPSETAFIPEENK